MISIWSDTTSLPSFEELKEDISTDVLIIGGGITGLLCAYKLKQAGVDCVLTESSTICSGITKNTTAKITSQHGLIYHKLLDKFGLEKARMYLVANEEALLEYRQLCAGINCDFETKDAFVYSTNHPEKLQMEMDALDKIGFSAKYVTTTSLPFSVAGAVMFPHQAQFQPLKFLAHIAKDLTIYEHTQVQCIENNTAITEQGKIKASKIIATTHFPFLNKHGSYFLKLFQQRSYVIALEQASNVKGMYIDEADCGLSFRNYQNYLLIGGGGHRTGKQGGNWTELSNFAHQYYPNAKEAYRWATQDCMTLDGVPYIGHYSKNTPNLYVATGFNKWGMTSAMAAANLLRDMILEKESPYAPVFSPSRTMLRTQLLINGYEAVTNLLTFSTKRCPHMGCTLKWNPHEHSWDCPCHGSRFSKNGHLIDNPATGDIKAPQ